MAVVTLDCTPDAKIKLGVLFKGSDPSVTAVTAASQAESLGIKVGWKIVKINDKKAPQAAKGVIANASQERAGLTSGAADVLATLSTARKVRRAQLCPDFHHSSISF